MALDYGDVSEFARKHGKVEIRAGRGAKVTVLKSGELDAHALIEATTTRFTYKGKTYTSEAFQKLIRVGEQD